MKKMIAVAVPGSLMLAATIHADYVGLSIELFESPDWAPNGYDAGAMDTYRVYVNFDDPRDALAYIYANPNTPASVWSSDGVFLNDTVVPSLQAPEDLTGPPFHYWANQWDTYLTCDTTTATGDVSFILPPGAVATPSNDLSTSFTIHNALWGVAPDDQMLTGQGVAGADLRVMIAQFTVNEGVLVTGLLNVELPDGSRFTGQTFGLVPAPGAIVPFALLVCSRRRRSVSGSR